MIFLNPIPPDVKRELFVKVDKSIPLYVPAESVEKYKAAEGWNDYGDTFQIMIDVLETDFDVPSVVI